MLRAGIAAGYMVVVVGGLQSYCNSGGWNTAVGSLYVFTGRHVQVVSTEELLIWQHLMLHYRRTVQQFGPNPPEIRNL